MRKLHIVDLDEVRTAQHEITKAFMANKIQEDVLATFVDEFIFVSKEEGLGKDLYYGIPIDDYLDSLQFIGNSFAKGFGVEPILNRDRKVGE